MFDLRLKRAIKLLAVGLVLLLLLPAAALAGGREAVTLAGGEWRRGEDWHKVLFGRDSAMSGDYVVLKEGVTAKGPGFYAGQVVRLNGSVDGTAFAAGQKVTINGDVKGDLFAAGQEVTVNGRVYGNLYAAGQDVRILGQVGGDAFVAGEHAATFKEAVIGRDILLFAANITHSGRVERQFFADSRSTVIDGSIGDNARLAVDRLEIQEGAELKGKLVYMSPNQAAVSPKAKAGPGAIEWKKAVPVVKEKHEPTLAGQLGGLLLSIAGALLVWFIVTAWKPHFWVNLTVPLFKEPGKTMGIGALALILTPVLAVILMATVIGLPAGLLLLLAYGVALFLAKIITAVFIGNWLAGRFNWPVLHKGVWLVLLGLAIIAALTRLPFIGFLFTLVTVFWGLGAITLAFVRPRAEI